MSEATDIIHDNQQISVNTNSTETARTPPNDLDWESEKTKVKVKQFMNILEQLPRLCSPTICGTLSQPTTRTERMSRGADIFEWSLEQKAILSPANITTDMDGTGDWQNLADLNPSWRQQESETFFSQRTIAPSPMITTTPSARSFVRSSGRPTNTLKLTNPIYNEEDEEFGDEADLNQDQFCPFKTDDDKRRFGNQFEEDDDNNNFEEEDDDYYPRVGDDRYQMGEEEEGVDGDVYKEEEKENDDEAEDEDEHMDDLCFSPQPLRGSQTQQKMDLFSPETFVRVMEDENTLQSTPKTIGSQRSRHRGVDEMYD